MPSTELRAPGAACSLRACCEAGDRSWQTELPEVGEYKAWLMGLSEAGGLGQENAAGRKQQFQRSCSPSNAFSQELWDRPLNFAFGLALLETRPSRGIVGIQRVVEDNEHCCAGDVNFW